MEADQDTYQVAESERIELLGGMVLDVIHRQKITKVGDVVASLQKLDKFLSTSEIHEAIKRLENRGEINLSEARAGFSFIRDLGGFEANAPFWIAIIATAAVLAATFALPQDGLWIAAKRIAGAVFLFAVPGYVLSNVLVARNRLSTIERIAVSVGLSLAVVSLLGMVLAYGVAGVKLEPVMASVTAFVVALAFMAAHRDFVRRRQTRVLHLKFLDERSTGGQ